MHMEELVRTNDLVTISALKAALAAEGILVIEFDGDIASTYGGIDAIPRRLMVTSDDLASAMEVAKVICPDLFR